MKDPVGLVDYITLTVFRQECRRVREQREPSSANAGHIPLVWEVGDNYLTRVVDCCEERRNRRQLRLQQLQLPAIHAEVPLEDIPIRHQPHNLTATPSPLGMPK